MVTPIHSDVVQDALRSIATIIILPSTDPQEMDNKLSRVIDLDETDSFLRELSANRIVTLMYQILLRQGSTNARHFLPYLRTEVSRIEKLRCFRDALLKKMSFILDGNGIDYVTFKTLNKSGTVGVDIDIMIQYDDFDRCATLLQNQGFHAIDDLSKKYATGFMWGDNPITLDLHTDLTVLGIRYLSPDSLLSSKRKIRFQSSVVSETFNLSVLDEVSDATVRMAHSVIKEGSVSVADILEPIDLIRRQPDAIVEYVTKEGLQTAVAVFMKILTSMHHNPSPKSRIPFYDDEISSLARALVAQLVRSPRLPMKLPMMLSLVALFDRLDRNKEMTDYLLLSAYSLKHRRNVQQLGQKILSHFV